MSSIGWSDCMAKRLERCRFLQGPTQHLKLLPCGGKAEGRVVAVLWPAASCDESTPDSGIQAATVNPALCLMCCKSKIRADLCKMQYIRADFEETLMGY